jgi:hypothetical protein
MEIEMLDMWDPLPEILDGDGMEENARQWEEEGHLAHKEEECRKMGWRWVDLDGDRIKDVLGDI